MSSLCARFSFFSLCEIFYVNFFVCKTLCMISLASTQNDHFKNKPKLMKQPYIKSGLSIRHIKKKVVEHCCRNCPFLGRGFGRYGLWLTIVTSLSQGAHPSLTPDNWDFPYLNQVPISFLCPTPARIPVSGQHIDLLVICCKFLVLTEKSHLKSSTTLPSWIFQNPTFDMAFLEVCKGWFFFQSGTLWKPQVGLFRV